MANSCVSQVRVCALSQVGKFNVFRSAAEPSNVFTVKLTWLETYGALTLMGTEMLVKPALFAAAATSAGSTFCFMTLLMNSVA